MNLVEVVILVGAQCLSPIEQGPGLTEAGKVPCAVLVRQDPQTSDIEIIPEAAATDPDVIAMLVKPHGAGSPVIKADRMNVAAAADDVTGSITPASPAPRIVPVAAEAESDAVPVKPTPPVKKAAKLQVAKTRVGASSRTDACGSYKAVWYTNKDGRRKYRCVKAG